MFITPSPVFDASVSGGADNLGNLPEWDLNDLYQETDDPKIDQDLIGGAAIDKHGVPITDEVFYRAVESDAVIVSIICDRGDRYISTGIFNK